MSGRAPDGRRAARPGPLAARPHPRPAGRRPEDLGRLRRFARRYGWRAYAIPLLTLATIAVLVELAVRPPAATTAATAEPVPASPSVTAAVPTTPAEPVVEPVVPAEADAGPPVTAPPAVVEQYVEQGAGTLSVVDSTSGVHGSGPLRRFVVEVEDGIGVDGAAFAEAVTATLADPRSWGNGGRMSFQRVGAGAAYDFKVSLVSPGSMETYCPGVGTGGYTSCRYGERAVINLARWATAVPHYDGDVATYRQYVVNHEVGHALGNGHRPCPGPGQPAPVMQQQTLGLEGCVRNAWPHP